MSKIVINSHKIYTEDEFDEICQYDEVVDENDNVVLLVEMNVRSENDLFSFLEDDN